MDFNGKVAIVTGSSSGIGQATALLFGEGGASVTIHGQSEERLKQTEELLKNAGVADSKIHLVLGPIENDETQHKLINETVQKFGKLDILVNCAGIPNIKGLNPDSIENFDTVIKINLKSVITLTELAIPHLEKTKGNIVNISSIGSERASTAFGPYVISKAGLDHFTRNAALKYAPKGVRVNTVRPGVTMTNFMARSGKTEQMVDDFVKSYEKVVPLGRLANSREVANVIAFLASDFATYVTGSNYVVDGGILAGSSARPDEKTT